MADQAGGLVDHQQLVVLADDVEKLFHARRPGQEHTGQLPGSIGRIQERSLAAAGSEGVRGMLTLQAQQPDKRSTELGELVRGQSAELLLQTRQRNGLDLLQMKHTGR